MSKSNSTRLLAYNDSDGHYERLHMETTSNGNCLMVVDDESNSSLNTIEANSTLTASRLSNVQDWIGTSGGDGTGVKTGVNIAEILVDTDECVSKLTDISSNATLTASRLSNVQDWIGTSGGDGTGVKTGVNIASLAGCVSGNELQVDIVSGSVSISGGATEAKQDDMEISLNAIETGVDLVNTNLTTMDGVLDNILVKNTEIDTAVDLVNTNLGTIDGVLDNILVKNTEIDTAVDEVVDNTSYLDPTANKKSATAIYSTSTTITDTNFIGGTIDCQGYSSIRIYGEATTSFDFHAQVSDDNTNFFPTNSLLIYPSKVQNSTNYYFDSKYDNPPRYLKLKNDSGHSITFNHLRYTLFP